MPKVGRKKGKAIKYRKWYGCTNRLNTDRSSRLLTAPRDTSRALLYQPFDSLHVHQTASLDGDCRVPLYRHLAVHLVRDLLEVPPLLPDKDPDNIRLQVQPDVLLARELPFPGLRLRCFPEVGPPGFLAQLVYHRPVVGSRLQDLHVLLQTENTRDQETCLAGGQEGVSVGLRDFPEQGARGDILGREDIAAFVTKDRPQVADSSLRHHVIW